MSSSQAPSSTRTRIQVRTYCNLLKSTLTWLIYTYNSNYIKKLLIINAKIPGRKIISNTTDVVYKICNLQSNRVNDLSVVKPPIHKSKSQPTITNVVQLMHNYPDNHDCPNSCSNKRISTLGRPGSAPTFNDLKHI